MRRRYFLAVVLLSTLLGASTVWWWMHSSTRMNQLIFRQSSGDTVRILGCDGKLLLTRTMMPADKAGEDADYQPTELSWVTIPYTPGADKSQPELKWASFHYSHDMAPRGVIESSFVLPIWVFTAAFAVVPLVWCNKKVKLMKKLAS